MSQRSKNLLLAIVLLCAAIGFYVAFVLEMLGR